MKILEVYLVTKEQPMYIALDNDGRIIYKPHSESEWKIYPVFDEIRINKKYRKRWWNTLKDKLSHSPKINKIREVK